MSIKNNQKKKKNPTSDLQICGISVSEMNFIYKSSHSF